MKHVLWAATAIGLVSAAGGAASAQTASPTDSGLEEIIVTAQQRSENLQRAAISVAAIGGDVLAKSGVTDSTALTNLVPSFRSNPAPGPYANFTIRGINNFTTNSQQDNGTVVNIGGVPLARPSGPNAMFYDLERIEILKGPQGILYGRNATAGVVNIIPRAPGNEFGGSASLTMGNYDLFQANAAVDIPLSDTLTTRTAFQAVRHDGYFSDGTSDEDTTAGRVTLRYAPSTDLKVTIVGDYARQRGMGPGTNLLYSETATSNTTGLSGPIVGPWVGALDPNPLIQNVFINSGVAVRRYDSVFQDNNYWGVTGTLEWATPIGTVTAIAAHRVTNVNFESITATFYNGEDAEQNQDSVEVRLASGDDQPFRYLAGLFFLDEKAHVQQINEQGTGLSNASINIHNRTVAGFTQLTYAFTDSFRISGGIRFNRDIKKSYSPRYTIPNYPFDTVSLRDRPAEGVGNFVSLVDQKKSFNSTTWKAGVEFDAAPDSLLYANVATGFKAGGFSYGPPGGIFYEPEHIISYVIGSKNRFLDRRLQLNIEAFYMRYTDQQVQSFAFLPGIGNFTITQNAAKSTVKGFEWDAIFLPVQTTRLSFSGQYMKARYNDFIVRSASDPSNRQTCPTTPDSGSFLVDCSGRPLVNAPTWVLQGGIDQTFEFSNGGNVVVSISERFESARETYLSYLRETYAPSYNRTDASLTYNAPSRNWSLTAWIRNIEDKAVVTSVNPGRTYSITGGGLMGAMLQPPRTFGARVNVNF
ncbi:MAG TPA: TonB-dependent receptor [Sphingomonadaceae bacterium]|nr:TonB-dependent receptor [Sphingomonadaceae bacterium]